MIYLRTNCVTCSATFVSNADLFCILPYHIKLVVSETDPDRLLTSLH